MKRIILFSLISFLSIDLVGCQTVGVSTLDPSLPYQGYSADQLMQKVEVAAAKGDFSKAVVLVNALEALYPYDKNRERRILDAIYIYYSSGKEELALAQCDLYHLEYPRGKHSDYVNYMYGTIEFDSSSSSFQRLFKIDPSRVNDEHFRNAYKAFAAVVNTPNSIYALDATYRLHYLRNIFAKHQLIIANYYYQRGAYVAAANRARNVVMHFNGTSSMTQALQIMQSSYKHLGLISMANQAQVILQQH